MVDRRGRFLMEFITVNSENINTEDICCANSDKCASSKKAWLKERFNDGMIFKKLNARGKVFIEFVPAENAWCPIIASDYMFIDCFWVSGSFKGKGYATRLLNECIGDSRKQGKKGIVALSSKKKMPFLSDPKFFKYKGFQVADTCNPHYELLYLPFDEVAVTPKFKDCVKQGTINEKGIVLYYSDHCPYNSNMCRCWRLYQKNVVYNLLLIKLNQRSRHKMHQHHLQHIVYFMRVNLLQMRCLAIKNLVPF
jgi:N-acetylglutamate synthase-like GNAT family acetyltransferase